MVDDPHKKFGQQLRKVRAVKGISQEVLAYDTGVARSYLWRIEQGLANPTISIVGKLAQGLKVNLKELFDW